MRTRFERDVANVLGPMSAAADNLGKAETNIHALHSVGFLDDAIITFTDEIDKAAFHCAEALKAIGDAMEAHVAEHHR